LPLLLPRYAAAPLFAPRHYLLKLLSSEALLLAQEDIDVTMPPCRLALRFSRFCLSCAFFRRCLMPLLQPHVPVLIPDIRRQDPEPPACAGYRRRRRYTPPSCRHPLFSPDIFPTIASHVALPPARRWRQTCHGAPLRAVDAFALTPLRCHARHDSATRRRRPECRYVFRAAFVANMPNDARAIHYVIATVAVTLMLSAFAEFYSPRRRCRHVRHETFRSQHA